MRMKDKVALISGAASGMGAATARLFGREGAMVFVADILDKEGAEVVESIKKAGGKARYLRLDVTNEAQWQAAIAEIEKAAGVLLDLGEGGLPAGLVGDVEMEVVGSALRFLDAVDDLGALLVEDVGDEDRGAFATEQPRRCRPHAARCSGDQRHLVLHAH